MKCAAEADLHNIVKRYVIYFFLSSHTALFVYDRLDSEKTIKKISYMQNRRLISVVPIFTPEAPHTTS